MKVLLIEPFVIRLKKELRGKLDCEMGLGIRYLGAELVASGFDVEILDCFFEGYNNRSNYDVLRDRVGLSDIEIKKRISDIKPDVVGVSCVFFFNREAAHHICGLAKEVNPKITTVMGGIYPTVFTKEALNDNNLDYIVIGEGEQVFRELAASLRDGLDTKNIMGIALKDKAGFRVNPRRSYIENLDLIQFPIRSKKEIEEYSKLNAAFGAYKQTPYATVLTSRGCPFECIFCAAFHIWDRKIRYRSSENVLSELDFLINEYGVKEIHFVDENLSLNRTRFKAILEGMIERGYHKKITWTCPNGIAVYSLDNEIVDLMKESGCYSISLAIESGDQKLLRDVIKKPLDLEHALKITRHIQTRGIKTRGFFIIGFPDQTKKSVLKTVNFANYLKLDMVGMNALKPYPATVAYDEAVKNEKVDSTSYDLSRLTNLGFLVKGKDFDQKWIKDIIETDRFMALLRRNPKRFFILLSQVFSRNGIRGYWVLGKIIYHSLIGDIDGKKLW